MIGAFLGVMTSGGLGVLWFRMVPQMMEQRGIGSDALAGAAAFVTHLAFQIPVFTAVGALLAAGLATRVTRGRESASGWVFAGGLLGFAVLLFSVNVLYEPVLAPLVE
jgi:hypothetical protein